MLDWIESTKGIEAAPVVASVKDYLSSMVKSESEGTLGFVDFIQSLPYLEKDLSIALASVVVTKVYLTFGSAGLNQNVAEEMTRLLTKVYLLACGGGMSRCRFTYHNISYIFSRSHTGRGHFYQP